MRVHDFLTNPSYAGAFVFGRTRQEKRLDAAGKVKVTTLEVPIEEWSVRLPARAPSGLCVLGGVPRHPPTAAIQREAARQGWRRRP
jgi:hypothetical protein